MKTYRCPACGVGTVDLRPVGAETVHFKNIPDLSIGPAYQLPQCDQCGERFLDQAEGQQLDAQLEAQFRSLLASKAKASLGKLKVHLPAQKLEQLLGLSHGYLSKLSHEAKEPSPPLVAVLLLLAEKPELVGTLAELWRETPRAIAARPAQAPAKAKQPAKVGAVRATTAKSKTAARSARS